MQPAIPRVFAAFFLAMTMIVAPSLAQQPPTPPPSPPSPPQEAPAAPAPAAPAPAAPAAPVVEKVKIVVDDKAKSDGEIRLLFTPEGGEAKTVRVTVQKGMDKKEVCRDLTKELAVILGSKYKVDHYDADKVKVEVKDGAKFSLTIAAQTVTGLSVKLD